MGNLQKTSRIFSSIYYERGVIKMIANEKIWNSSINDDFSLYMTINNNIITKIYFDNKWERTIYDIDYFIDVVYFMEEFIYKNMQKYCHNEEESEELIYNLIGVITRINNEKKKNNDNYMYNLNQNYILGLKHFYKFMNNGFINNDHKNKVIYNIQKW